MEMEKNVSCMVQVREGAKKGDNRMNKIMMGVMLVALMCITMVAPAMALEPSTPFMITGHVSDSGGSPCNDPTVLVTNTNTSASWDADNDSASNYYNLILDINDVSAGDILRFEASGCSESKTVEHAVTQSELEDGGMFDFDIVFDAPQEIIWQGDVTLINGTTFDVTANSSVSYVINRTTALGALDAAAEEGVFNYTVNDDWYASWGSLFVDSIADIPSEGYNGWMYWVNYPEDPMPMVGADQFVLEDGDVVTWYWSSSMEMTPADSPMIVKINAAVKPDLTATYDFATDAGLDRWAYKYQTDAKPAANGTTPDIEFATPTNPKKDQYVKISTDNRKMQADSTDLDGYYATHRFVFDISQPVEDILTIKVLWNGKGANKNRDVLQGATLYIRNCTSGAYEELANMTSNREAYLTGEATAEIGSYIDATGNLTVLVEQNSPQTVIGKRSLVSKLSTDYVKVDITHT